MLIDMIVKECLAEVKAWNIAKCIKIKNIVIKDSLIPAFIP